MKLENLPIISDGVVTTTQKTFHEWKTNPQKLGDALENLSKDNPRLFRCMCAANIIVNKDVTGLMFCLLKLIDSQLEIDRMEKDYA